MSCYVLTLNERRLDVPNAVIYTHETSAGWYDYLYQLPQLPREAFDEPDHVMIVDGLNQKQLHDQTPDSIRSRLFLVKDPNQDFTKEYREQFAMNGIIMYPFKTLDGTQVPDFYLLFAQDLNQLLYLTELQEIAGTGQLYAEIHSWYCRSNGGVVNCACCE